MTSPSSSMTVTSVAPSESLSLDALVAGIKWGASGSGATVAYSFPYANSDPVWATDYSRENEPGTGSGFGVDHQVAARQALQLWANVADLHFVETTETPSDVGDIRFAYTQTPAITGWWGWSSYPSAYWPAGGDVWVNAMRAFDDWSVGSSQFSALLHEIGHALGLKHPFAGLPVLPMSEDSEQFTLMSYTDHPHALFREVEDRGGGSFSWTLFAITPQTPMLYDIAAIQHLYGANTNYRSGDDTYTFAPDSPFFMTIWDAGGQDTISVANFTTACTIDLRAGFFSDIAISADPLPAGASGDPATYDGTDNLAIAFGVTIENATGGAGNDTLIGNSVSNSLRGGAGADTMSGGDGRDYYFVDDVSDQVIETNPSAADNDSDLVFSYLPSYTLTANVERLWLFASDGNGTGNSLDNSLYASSGNNVLDGGAGNDTATYVNAGSGVSVDLGITTAQATGGSGSDTLISIENLVGSQYSDRLTGNSGANRLEGGAGSDSLRGGGGADTLVGGDGRDYYYVHHAGDVVVETNTNPGSSDSDLVFSYLPSYTLTANVERLWLFANNASGTGNSLDNSLYASGGNNVLAGGAGNDTLSGGVGNDTLSGGSGADHFRFDSLLNALSNRDTITDFNVAADTIELENAIFGSLTSTGTLASGSFRSGAGVGAADANDYVLYDSASGALYYDGDGNGLGAAVQFASLSSGLALTNADFLVT